MTNSCFDRPCSFLPYFTLARSLTLTGDIGCVFTNVQGNINRCNFLPVEFLQRPPSMRSVLLWTELNWIQTKHNNKKLVENWSTSGCTCCCCSFVVIHCGKFLYALLGVYALMGFVSYLYMDGHLFVLLQGIQDLSLV